MTTIQNPKNKQSLIRWIFINCRYLLIFGIDLFLPAKDWKWGMAWIYLGVYAINILVLTLILPPDLLAERSQRKENSKSWDIILAALAAMIMPMAAYIVAGLDHNNGWSTNLPFALQIIAAVIMTSGIAFTSWAMTSNKFFSALVRIQQDRGHAVQDTGPYRLVRHPGYVGGIIHHLTMPLMLGSWWALIPSGIGALLLILRTALEDKTLQAELPGYTKYTQKTRYRLIPGIW